MGTAYDSVVQDASKAIDVSGAAANTQQGLQIGMSLAQRQQEIENKRQEMDFQKQRMEIQKGDWLHSQLSSITSENDPKIRSALIDNMNESFPKMFDGRRIDPTQMELLKKSDSWMDKVGALTRVRKAFSENNPAGISDFDKGVINQMSSSDIATNWQHLNTMQQNETSIVKALIAKGVAPQAAVTAAGGNQTQEQLQQTMRQSNPFQQRNEQMLDDQASKAGGVYDSALKKVFTQKQALDRATHTLTDPNTPITPQIFRESEKEFVAALSGSGATGVTQAEKTEYDDLHLKSAQFLQKYGNKIQDLRTAAPELVNQLQSSINRLSGAYSNNMEDIASKVDKNFSQSSNQKVQNMRRIKLKDYAPKYHAATFGDEEGQTESAPGVNPNLAGVNEPAQPKPSPSDAEQVDNQAKEFLRQARAAAQAGVPFKYTEKQVKDAYKNATGRDLVE